MKHKFFFSKLKILFFLLFCFINLNITLNAEAFFWIPQTDLGSKSWSDITISDNGQNLAASVSGGNIYTSSNGGSTWATSTDAGVAGWTSIISSSNGQNIFATLFGTDLYTSTTSGATWVTVPVGTYGLWSGVSASDDGVKITLLKLNLSIFNSTTSGATWVQNLTNTTHYWSSVASSDNGNKVVAVDSGYYHDNILGWQSDGYIYTSGDSGSTWATSTEAGFRRWWGVASSDDGNNLVAVAWGGYIYTSTTSGATWATSTSSGIRNWSGITSSSNGSKLAATVDNGSIYVSNDSGSTWIEQTDSGPNSWSSITSSSDGKNLAAVSSGGYLYLSSMISQPQSTTSATTATITFNTSNNSNSSIAYGLTSFYGSSTASGSSTTTHMGVLTNLACNTTYHYQASATDELKTSTLTDRTFRTQRCSNYIAVTTPNDDGDGTCTESKCTFRDAVSSSEAGNVITFGGLTGTIVISQDISININHDLSIVGPGADKLTIDFDNKYNNYIYHTGGSLDISGLSMTKQTQDVLWEETYGAGTLVLSNVKFNNNIGEYSPLYISSTSGVVLNYCEFTNNITSSNGGVIYISNESSITINNSTFSGNTSNGSGGVIYFDAFKPGIDEPAYLGLNPRGLVISNSTFVDNSALSYGSIYSGAKNTNITNSTFSNTSLVQDYSVFIGGNSNIGNSIFYSVNNNNCAGVYTSSGHNIESGSTCGFNQSGDISSSSNILLDPDGLKDNGGLIKTIALMVGSAAIDSADNSKASTTDARGFVRPQDGDNNGSLLADMGAYELLSVSTPSTSIPSIQTTVSRHSSSGGIHYGCKDSKAINYNYFSYSKPSLCIYDSPILKKPKISTTLFLRDLQIGMIGLDVKMLQQFLNNNNYIVVKIGPGSKGQETTKFGPSTKSALIKYQKANKITHTIGYFGPNTRSVVNNQIKK